MGNQCCAENENSGAKLIGSEGVPDDKAPAMWHDESRILADKPVVIDQEIPAPAPPPPAPPVVEAPAQQEKPDAKTEPEIKAEPDPEPLKVEETKEKSVTMVFHALGSGVELFTINHEISKKINELRVRRGASQSDPVSYRIPTSASVKLHIDASASQRDWWKVFSATEESGMCIGLAGWVIKKVDRIDTLSEVSAPNKGEDQTVYVQRKPLGLVFKKECPIKVKDFKKDSHGQEVGIQKGWILKSINGEEFANLTQFEDAMGLIKKHIDALPS